MRTRVLRLTLVVTLALLAGSAQPEAATPQVGPYPCPPPCRVQ